MAEDGETVPLIPFGFSIWASALARLNETDRITIQTTSKLNCDELLKLAEQKRAEAKQKSLQWTCNDGHVVDISDIYGRIANCIQKYINCSDSVVHISPEHLAAPWLCFRILLEASTEPNKKNLVILQTSETASQLLAWCKFIEQLPIPQTLDNIELVKKFREEIIELYVTILQFSAAAIRWYSKNSFVHTVASIFGYETVSAFASQLSEQEKILRRYFNLILQKFTQKDHDKMNNKLDKLTYWQASCDHEKFLDWISDIPYALHHNEAYGKILEGTGKWLLEEAKLLQWKSSSSSQIFWLHGIPGSGKTSLFSILVQYLKARSIELGEPYPAYFYCMRDHAEPQRSNLMKILRTLLLQLLRSVLHTPILHGLHNRFQERRDQGPLLMKEIKDFILRIIANQPKTYIFIDALDECSPKIRAELVTVLKYFLKTSHGVLKIFISSRNDQSIASQLKEYPNQEISTSNNQEDIVRFIDREIDELYEQKVLLPDEEISDDLKNWIKRELQRKAEGMFQWVELQLHYLCQLSSTESVQTRLGSLPETLRKIYEDIYQFGMNEIQEEKQKKLTIKIFQRLLYAHISLTPIELSQLDTAGNYGEMGEGILTVQQILRLTFNLVVLDRELGIFRFAHPSVAEFLKGQQDFSNSNIELDV